MKKTDVERKVEKLNQLYQFYQKISTMEIAEDKQKQDETKKISRER